MTLPGSKFGLNPVAISLTFVTLEAKYRRQIITFRAQRHARQKKRKIQKFNGYNSLLTVFFQAEVRSGDK